jgi:hypothetical protein
VGESRQELVFAPVGIAPVTLLVQLRLDFFLGGQNAGEFLGLALEGGPGARQFALGLLKRTEQAPDIFNGRWEWLLLRFVGI